MKSENTFISVSVPQMSYENFLSVLHIQRGCTQHRVQPHQPHDNN